MPDNDPKTFKIIGAAIEVHKELGPGFLEAVYQEAVAGEFSTANIPFKREQELDVRYKGSVLDTHYRADFICYEYIIVELKTVDGFDDVHMAQVLNYLKATGMRVGILLNFKSKSLQFKRIVYDESYPKS